MDARQRVATDSLKTLVESFADPAVGCVSGALMLGDGEETSPRGVGSYWKLEKAIRYWESTGGSTVGATGALYAVRRTLVPHLPTGIILDDVFIPMEVARRGARVIFEPRALAWDSLPSKPKQEFRRKVRTLFGNYQLLRMAPWLLTTANPLRFEFVSHKAVSFGCPVCSHRNDLVFRLSFRFHLSDSARSSYRRRHTRGLGIRASASGHRLPSD